MTGPGAPRVQWDEGERERGERGGRAPLCPRIQPSLSHQTRPPLHPANLEENERIKAELAPAPIDEPKTPYHPPLGDDDVDADDDRGSGDEAARGISPLEAGSEGARRFEEALAEREAEDAARGGSRSSGGRSATRSSDEWGGGDGWSGGSYGDEDAESKRRRFEERRKKHYQMGAALKAAPAPSDDDDDDERDGGGGGGSNGTHRNGHGGGSNGHGAMVE